MSRFEKFQNQIKILDSKSDFVHHENRDLFQSFSDLSKAILQALNENSEDFNRAVQKMRTIHSHFKNKEASYLKQISEFQEAEKHEETTELPKANLELDEKLKTLRSQNVGLQSQVEQLDSQNTKLKNIIQQCVGKDKELQSSLGPLIDEISELKEDVRRAKQENDSYPEDKVKSLVKENSQLKEILEEFEGKLNDLQGQKDKLVDRNEKMSNRIVKLTKKNQELIRELENSESNDAFPDKTQEIDERVSLKQKIAHLQETKDKVTSDLNTCLDEKKLIEKKLSAKNKENLSLKQKNSQLGKTVAEISRTSKTYEETIKRLQIKQELQEQGEDCMQNDQILKLKQENQQLKKDFDTCQKRLNNYKDLVHMEKMDIKNKMLEVDKKNEQLQAHIQHLETEMQEATEYLSVAKSCLTKAKPAEACPNCVKLKEDFQAGYQSLTAELEALKNENKEKTQEIEKKRKKMKDMSNKISDYRENKREIQTLKETCSSLTDQISFYENKRLSEDKGCQTVDLIADPKPAEACPHCVKLEEDFQAGYQSLTAELEALKNENEDKTQEIEKKQRKIKDMSDKMSDYREKKREIEQLKETCSSLKYQISFYENKRLIKDKGCQTVESLETPLPNKCLTKNKGCQTVESLETPLPNKCLTKHKGCQRVTRDTFAKSRP
nr:uncharacterized protein LOC107373405 [Nothobranchius furzeri]